MAKVKVNTNMIFKRYEKKYLLSLDQYEALIERLAFYVRPDEYGLHTINSVYYDTDDYSIIRKSLDKPKFREKLRLRSYGLADKDDTVYLELKKKFDGVTYKRRMGLSLHAATAYLDYGVLPPLNIANAPIFGEIDWFIRKHKPTAKALLSYDRIAMVGREEEELRITFDNKIRWCDTSFSLSKANEGSLLRPPEIRLMEIKTLSALPLWLCNILSPLKIYPSSFSKFGKVYTEHLMNPLKEVAYLAG